GGVTLTAGTLNVNSPTALGTGPLTITGGRIDSTAAGPITVSTNNPITLGGNFGYGGTRSLNLGTGAVTPTTDVAVTVAGTGTLTFGGTVGGGQSVTLIGAGTGGVSFTAASLAFNNLTNNSAGTLTVGPAGGTTTVAGNLANTGPGTVVLSGNTAVAGNLR